MTSRPDPFATHFDLVKPLIAFGQGVQTGLDHTIAEFIKIRASQLNGCAACLHMHVRDARAHGETDERMHLLNAWRESRLFTEREKAVLGWTEAMTRVESAAAQDEAFAALQRHFTDDEQIRITLLIGAINAFNRVNVGLHVQPRETAGQAA